MIRTLIRTSRSVSFASITHIQFLCLNTMPPKKRTSDGTGDNGTAKKNKTSSDFTDTDFKSNKKTEVGDKDWNFKISSWNVDGLRAWVNKGGLEYFKHENPDVVCLQEIKCTEAKIPNEVKNLPEYPHKYWNAATKEGYAGVALMSKVKPLKVDFGLGHKEFDDEGRLITAEFEEFFLVNTYVPNAGRKLVTLPKRMDWDPLLRKHVKELDSKKPVILCGDLNVAHKEIDLANPKTNKKSAGFTKEEREGFDHLVAEGFVDTFRHFNPDKEKCYTFWTYMMNARAKNVGWRLDYFVTSERFVKTNVCDNVIRDQIYGSDHCPSTLFINV